MKLILCHAKVVPGLGHIRSEHHRLFKTCDGLIRLPGLPVCHTQIIPCFTNGWLFIQHPLIDRYGPHVIVFLLFHPAKVIACRQTGRIQINGFFKYSYGLIRPGLVQKQGAQSIQSPSPIRLYFQYRQIAFFRLCKPAFSVS